MMGGFKIMPDHSSTGLWDAKTGIMHDLILPSGLSKEFKDWIDYYEQCFESDWATFKPGRTGRLNTWGLELAHKVKELFPGSYVEYVGEDENGVFDHKEVFL